VRLEDIQNSLIVSCQPVPGGPMDSAEMVVGFALAALAAGAKALRVESVPYVAAVRGATTAPIIGIVKQDRTDTEVRITPLVEQVVALAQAGADVIAFDATRRQRPVPVAELAAAVKAQGRLAMADCSDLEDARAALAAGVDFVGTTLSGYAGGPVPEEPDFALISALRTLTPHVIAEGRIRTTAQAAEAARRGAWSVVVGSAITRTEHATEWFRDAVEGAARIASHPALAIDIGGTKTLVALVEGAEVLEAVTLATSRDEGPDAWIAALANETKAWRGRYTLVGAAVTGLVSDGTWSALNPATLTIPDDYPIVDKLSAAFGVPAYAANDAQAAAWGEYRYGAGENADTVFLTISTGIGGGVVIGGRPLLGLAGHFGLLRSPSRDSPSPFENEVSGRWMAAEAARSGHVVDAQGVFAAARRGEPWADAIIAESAARVALLCEDLQLAFDPKRIVIGGGIGLAEGYLDRLRALMQKTRPRLRPQLVSAKLGVNAGLIGVADLASISL
jgi:N-acetylmannosamine-6-phosphate 2-epimerase/N-acetylmannosamine kinase